jgi:hypothetical protein
MLNLGEVGLREMALAVATNGMRDAGYTNFNLDDGWAGQRLANGSITAAPAGFPSGTLAPLAAYVTSLGLQLGTYTDRGTSTCAGRTGSKGFEAMDVATYIDWGISYVKVDSCNSAQDFPSTLRDYRAFAAPLAAAGVFFSVCGWSDWLAGASPQLGSSWRINQDASFWTRFLENLKSAAAVANLTGPGRGWPDVDMISGRWSAAQEVAHLSAIAVIGSPLLLSFDPRTANASTLGLQAYLNPELIAIHQDAPLAGAPYYARVAGADAQGENATRLLAVNCSAPEAVWTYTPVSANANTNAPGFGTLAAAGSGMCLGLWDLFPGKCVNAVYAGTVPCGTGGALGCPHSAQLWALGNASNGWALATALNYSGGTPLYPGAMLTSTAVPGSYYVQPQGAAAAGGGTQSWAHTLAPGVAGQTVLRGADGRCLAPAASGAFNVWARWLACGDVALLLINFGAVPAAVTCNAACMASLPRQGVLPPTAWAARDIWARAAAGTLLPSGYVSPMLPADGGSLLLRLTPVA